MKARDAERRIFDGLEALATHLGALREERSHVLIVSDGWLQYTEDESLLARRTFRAPEPPIGGRRRQPVGVISSQGTVTLTEQAWRQREADLQSLARLDHRNGCGWKYRPATRFQPRRGCSTAVGNRDPLP